MFDEILAQHGTKFLVAALAVVLGLACLALVLWIVRRRPSSPFIRGGRNRQPRLSVLDAAAVDTRRRLVLVRRDDVEHLLMIGGPTDIVVESRIVTTAPTELPEQAAQMPQPAVAEPAARPQPAARVETIPVPAAERAAPAPAQEAAVEPRPAVPMPVPAAVAVSPPVAAPVEPPVPPASRISSMGSVLYGAQSDISETPAAPPARPAPQEPPFARTVAAAVPVPPSPAERDAIDALDRARDRVLTNPVGIGSERVAAGDPARSPAGLPQRAVPDNAALVSEFEKMLEAEIAASPARPANPAGVRIEPAGQQPKTREETEAEMSRLLGELSANRKS